MLVLSSAEKTWITIKKYSCNTSVNFSQNVGYDPFNLKQMVLSFISISWAVEKEVTQCFNIKITSANRIKCVSKKLCLNLWSLKWLRLTWRRVRKISPFGWLTLKTLLLQGLTKFKTLISKVEHEGELQISKSNLFHSTNADGKKESRKKLLLILNWGIIKFGLFLVWYEILLQGINSHKYFEDCSLTILQKTESFRNYHLFWRDFNPTISHKIFETNSSFHEK